jgi:CDP-glucose 4,6-dehydratase
MEIQMTHQIYKGKNVFITGHTGFKGSWLSFWLQSLGANVTGYSLAPEDLSHFNLLKLETKNYFQNINDEETLNKAIKESKPDIIFHLAAQPLVRDSYEFPVNTYETNVVGSLKVYLAALKINVPAVVSITTDKVYENREWAWGYRENDQLGGHDPYSSSKACMELMTQSFQKSFLFDHKMYLATARAGNVIGGGDWAKDRLIPDLVRSAAKKGETPIRNPKSVRPWQHVLEPLNGYLMLGEKLLLKQKEFCTSFNFGPENTDVRSVEDMCAVSKTSWPDIDAKFTPDANAKHEAGLLKLDITKSTEQLLWKPLWNCEMATKVTINWYKNYYQNKSISTPSDLLEFSKLLK